MSHPSSLVRLTETRAAKAAARVSGEGVQSPAVFGVSATRWNASERVWQSPVRRLHRSLRHDRDSSFDPRAL